MLVCWWRSRRILPTKAGLINRRGIPAPGSAFSSDLGANQIFVSGDFWAVVDNYALGYGGSVIFSVAFQSRFGVDRWGIANERLAVYVIAAFLHGIVNFSVILIEDNKLTAVQSRNLSDCDAVMATCYHVMAPLANRKRNSRGKSTAGTAGDYF